MRLRDYFSARFYFAVILLIIGYSDASRFKHFHRSPIIDLSGAEELIGLISEDERIVTVSPQLRILRETGPICRYELNRLNGANDVLPFESHILDKTEGTAEIRLRPNAQIDCHVGEWHLQLIAVRCADDTARSEPVTMKITIKDTNNHAPQFEAPWYSFDVDEDKVGEIARIYATDGDCGHPYGEICRYEITNTLSESPFCIDDQGALTTIHPLNASYAESHLLTVVAHDCGMLSSKSTLVSIHVRAKCSDGIVIADVGNPEPNAVAHRPPAIIKTSTTETFIMPNTDVILCPREPSCTLKSAKTTISLANVSPLSFIDEQTLKRCGLSPATINLISNSSSVSSTDDDEDENDDESGNSNVDKKIEDDTMHFFDGKTTSITVPNNKLMGVIPQKFTLSFAMRHDGGIKSEQSIKQNILCETDDFAMNRHHFAVYIRHCKLELLLRREALDSKTEFRAAEWRWDTPEVCDDKWHAYAIRFTDLDHVELFVDGHPFGQTDRNPEILDDWPLHETKSHKTRLVVGACWHGRNQAMVQHFRGHLARMFLWAGGAELSSALRCLHTEQGKLIFNAIDQLVPGETIVSDKAQHKLTLKAYNLKNLATLLHAVKFETDIPAQKFSRHFSALTHVECAEENRTISLGEYTARIDVSPLIIRKPQLSIGGQTLISVERQKLKSGTPLIPNIQLVVTQPTDDGTMDKDVTAEHQLDWCKIHLKPSRDMDLEYFSSPAALISFLNIDFEHDKQGIMLKGAESIKNYADVLSKIRYYNTRPDSYNKRVYTIQCAMQGGKILSNELFVQMNVVDNADLEEAIDKLSELSNKFDSTPIANSDEQEILKLEKHFETSFDQLGSNRLQNILEMDLPRPKAFMGTHHGYEMGQGAVAGGAMAVLVVICIGLLLVFLVIGVLKMRDSPLPSRRQRRSRKPTMEGMEWDDNGLGINITVNPIMNTSESQHGVSELGVGIENGSIYASDAEDDDDSLEDEDGSYRGEDELTDDDGEEERTLCDDSENSANGTLLPHSDSAKQRLEWDDCTLPATRSTHNKSYCV